MKAVRPLFLVFLLALVLPGCNIVGGDLPDVECDDDVPEFKDVKALKDCADCHSSKNKDDKRRGAPEGINFDKYEQAAANAEIGVEAVFAGTMPPAGALDEDEELDFYKWGLCGTPE